MSRTQGVLFDERPEIAAALGRSGTFTGNMKMPVHRWFRYSAGFSADWVTEVLGKLGKSKSHRVLDPFAGSGTTLIAAQQSGVESLGLESHPFVARIAQAKLLYTTDARRFECFALQVADQARHDLEAGDAAQQHSAFIRKCYSEESLRQLTALHRAVDQSRDDSAASELTWLALVSILRRTATVGTAPWQYVLPSRTKRNVPTPFLAFGEMVRLMAADMLATGSSSRVTANLLQDDARDGMQIPDEFADVVITSPPYANNYDYADATRLEMMFLREIDGWGDLQQSVRQYLIRSCSQHVGPGKLELDAILSDAILSPLAEDLAHVCAQLAEIRLTKGGRKAYHLMIACYFHDMARVWHMLRRKCTSKSRICFVIGDSAPYGVYVPVAQWLGRLAIAAGFHSWTFEKLRDRNVKWKNRKHRVPLCEGHLWVEG